jgi:glycosyltransferase involved in cell wall biosynthesis
MTSPLVSVVIPTYNYGHYIREAIDSALAQTYPVHEIVVVNDGSTDNTTEILKSYGSRIRLCEQANGGPAKARNRGVQECRGELIAFLDADDAWLPRKIERQIEVLRELPEPRVVSTDLMPIDRASVRLSIETRSCRESEKSIVTLRDLLEFASVVPSSVMIAKDYFKKLGFFDETLAGTEDMEMWWRIASVAPIVKITERLTLYRVHTGSISHNADGMLSNHIRLLDKAFSSLAPLRQRPHWRRIAEARMYREVAFMRFSSGDRAGALRDLLRSGCRWPCALRDQRAKKKHLGRAKSFLRYSLVRKPGAKGAG